MEYYLGLDMGTNSVGWAVTDKNYHILRAKGKDLWGIREFDEAKPASERRSYRTARRRRQREKARIGLLKDYFYDEIYKVDPAFYQRLDNSFFKVEDKDAEVQYSNVLFNDKDFTDRDFRRKYPTIFHLRQDLIHSDQPHDVRLVYLAVLNIFKHRGHFLNMTLSADDSNISILEAYKTLNTLLIERTEINTLPQELDEDLFKQIMSDTAASRSKKLERLQEMLKIDRSAKAAIDLLKILVGLKVDVRKIFPVDAEEKIDVCFSDSGYEDKAPEIANVLGEEWYDIISVLKQIYDACAWYAVIGDCDYLSDARVESYDKHRKDLKLLKSEVRKYKSQGDYDKLFRSDEKGSYGDYVKSNFTDNNKKRRKGEHKQEDLYKNIRGLLREIEDPDVETILAEMDQGTFLPKQLTSSNGVIPYQAHYKELRAILNNAAKYLPFLNSKETESGKTVREEILQIFKFKLPYYVGPISKNSQFAWAVRKEEGSIRPWNLEEKIDVKQTSENFIQRMVRKCTYISGAYVLPKCSLLYERYCLLNELNSLAVDGERISPDLKQQIYEDLFTSGKIVTRKKIAKYLINRGLISTEDQITGIDIRVNSQLTNYHRFYQIFGDDLKTDSCKKMVENIIYQGTIFGEEKKFFKQRIEERYGDVLNKDQVKKILSIKFADWGRLSREFIELQGCDKSTGEVISLIDALWSTSQNMMELIHSDQFSFGERLSELESSRLSSLRELTIDDLDDQYMSAPVKRMVWQTLLIIKELEYVLGSAPKRVFVEMTRGDGEKKRTISRKQQFLQLYQGEEAGWIDIINKADESGRIRSKKMYLYLRQHGYDLYTGKEISLDDLFDNNIYDIDHIYPQSLTKDDNLDNNMVLTAKEVNNHKQNSYPLESSIRAARFELWKQLHQKGFINDEKFKRLTGSQPLSDEQLAGFVARQLVETSQSTKAVADILKEVFSDADTKVVYSKARVVSDFRHRYGLLKSRLVNDFHHAHDAYLNIVVGNSYYVKFTDNPYRYIKDYYALDREKYQYNLARFFDRDVSNGKEIAWIGSGKNSDESNEKGSILTVRKYISRPTPLMTRLTYVAHGGISDQTLCPADKAKDDVYLPLKGKDTRFRITKYGGYNKASTAYFFLVESEMGKKHQKVRTLETVPVYLAEAISKDPDLLDKYCIEVLGLINPSIRIRKIKIQSLIKWNGYFINLTGKTGKQLTIRNASSLFLPQEEIVYIKKLEKYQERNELDESITAEKNEHLYLVLLNKHMEGYFAKRPNPLGEKLLKHKDVFIKLDLKQQISVLLQILNTTAFVASATADLTLIGESKSTGVMRLPKKVSSANDAILFNQSVTGIFCSETNLLTV